MSDDPKASADDLRYCNCDDPENCTEPVEDYVCRRLVRTNPKASAGAPGVTPQSEVLVWLNGEQRKADRWAYSATGVYRFTLTGPELMRIRNALGAMGGEWQCRFVADDKRCCQLSLGHDGDHRFIEQAAAPASAPPEGIAAVSPRIINSLMAVCERLHAGTGCTDGSCTFKIAVRELQSLSSQLEAAQKEQAAAPASAPPEGIAEQPFTGLESYYQRLFQQIKQRREDNPPLGTGGDFDCSIAMIEWLWKKYVALSSQLEAVQKELQALKDYLRALIERWKTEGK